MHGSGARPLARTLRGDALDLGNRANSSDSAESFTRTGCFLVPTCGLISMSVSSNNVH